MGDCPTELRRPSDARGAKTERRSWHSRRALLGSLLLTAACSAEGDPFDELLSTLSPITETAAESVLFEVRDGDRAVGWGRMDFEAKPDASGGAYHLRQHFVFQTVPHQETIAATLEAVVDARFRPKRVRIEQAARDGESVAKAVDVLDVTDKGFQLGHVDDGGEPAVRMSGLPSRPFVVGIEYLLPRLPRERLDGATIVELDPQAGEVSLRKVKVIGLPRDRASIVVKDVDGEREATYTVDAKGHLEWIKQGTLTFSVCTVDRWETLRKQFPDVE